MERVFTSGDLARATGETVRTVRFYEEQGLLHPVAVSEGGHRRYDRATLERLQLILDFRELGLSIPDIRAMLAMRTGAATPSSSVSCSATGFQPMWPRPATASSGSAGSSRRCGRRSRRWRRRSPIPPPSRARARWLPATGHRASSGSWPGPVSAGECTSRARRGRPTSLRGTSKRRAVRTPDRSRSSVYIIYIIGLEGRPLKGQRGPSSRSRGRPPLERRFAVGRPTDASSSRTGLRTRPPAGCRAPSSARSRCGSPRRSSAVAFGATSWFRLMNMTVLAQVHSVPFSSA